MAGTQIEAGTRLRRTERVEDGGSPADGTVLFDADAGVTLRLNSTGAWIWHRLEQPHRVRELASGLAEHFEIDEARALGDVVAFAREMARRQLLAAD